MQEQVTFIGQLEVYGQSSETIKKLLRTKISGVQCYRITDKYGSLLKEDVSEIRYEEEIEKEDVVYVQVDGSMIFTDDGWQEVKVGRIFRQSDIEKQSKGTDRQIIKESLYTAHLGGHKKFLKDFDSKIANYKKLRKRLVFINDGARWIENWIKENYKGATSILDYYHVVENISKLGKELMIASDKFTIWLEKIKGNLLEGKLKEVENSILQLRAVNREQVDKKMKLIRFLRRNKSRINYKLFRRKGLQIGSGAIEAAHRTLIQERMKKSGQRWSDNGAQNMLNLRVCFKSRRWEDIVINKFRLVA